MIAVRSREERLAGPGRGVKRGRGRAALVTMLLIAGLNLLATANPTLTERALSSVVIALVAWIVTAWTRRAAWTNAFLVLFACLYAVYFALPIFALGEYTQHVHGRVPIPDEYIQEALWLVLAGLVMCLAGYRLAGLLAAARRLPLPTLRLVWDAAKVRRFGVVSGIGGVLAYALLASAPVPLGLKQAGHYVMDLSLFGILMLWLLQLDRQLGRRTTLLLWLGLVPTRAALGLATGLWTEGIEVGLVLLMGYSLARNRLPWWPMALVAAAVLVLAPVRVEFRALTWGPDAEKLSLTDKALVYPAVVTEYLASFDPVDAVQVTFSRLSHLITFAEVVEGTPGEVPYWGGETYYPLLFKLIPRLLYPDKPTDESGQAFGHRYSFLASSDTTTSHNLPQLVELYANFGPLGVLLGMFVIGAVYAVLVRLFVQDRAGLGALVAGSYVLVGLLLIESSASLVFGSLVWDLAFVGFIHVFVRARRAGG